MIPFATFDSEALGFLQAAVDQAWRSLPSHRRTLETKERMAKAVLRSAAQGERDPVRLNAIAAAVVLAEPANAYDIEVRQGDETMSSLRSVELANPRAVWDHIAELAKKVSAPRARIRVMDQSGAILISIGIAAARLLQST
jgi:hypothetical protein